ncbi:hypothetical protein AGIG_G18870 [Arapaima gigas]
MGAIKVCFAASAAASPPDDQDSSGCLQTSEEDTVNAIAVVRLQDALLALLPLTIRGRMWSFSRWCKAPSLPQSQQGVRRNATQLCTAEVKRNSLQNWAALQWGCKRGPEFTGSCIYLSDKESE